MATHLTTINKPNKPNTYFRFYVEIIIILYVLIYVIYMIYIYVPNDLVIEPINENIKNANHIYQYPEYDNHHNKQIYLSNVSEFSTVPTKPIVS